MSFYWLPIDPKTILFVDTRRQIWAKEIAMAAATLNRRLTSLDA
ncbi:MAG: hypothetical protein ACR2PL_28630 [Dehalococcoidia bacterium]